MIDLVPSMIPNASLLRESEAQARLSGWRWVALIGGRAISRAFTAVVTYGEDGSAIFELETDADLRGLGRAPVRVMCGWGSPRDLLFEGTLSDPVRDQTRSTTRANAYGVRGAMSSQYFDQFVDYSGMLLPQFFYEISRRLYDSRAVIDVREGFDVYLEDAEFEGESTLLEAADSVIGPVGHVALDRPGFDLLVSPLPSPAVGASTDVTLDASQWGPGDLELDPATDQIVFKVVVFRREAIGDSSEEFDIVRAESKVANPGPYYPKENEIHWIPDFPGDQTAAQRTADTTAYSRATANFAGNLQNVWANARLVPPKAFRLVRLEEGGDLRVTYACVVRSGSVDLVAGKMSTSFAALKDGVSEMLRRAPVRTRRPSDHIRRPLPLLFMREEDGKLLADDTRWSAPWFGTETVGPMAGRLFVDADAAPEGSGIGRDTGGRMYVDA